MKKLSVFIILSSLLLCSQAVHGTTALLHSSSVMQISSEDSELILANPYFLSMTFDPELNTNELTIQDPYMKEMLFSTSATSNLNVETQVSEASATLGIAQISGKALAYPSPMNQNNSEAGIYYRLTGPMSLEIRLYDIKVNLIYQKTYAPGTDQSKFGNNKISLNPSDIGITLPFGVYFFVLLSDNKVISKGKFGVVR